MTTTISMPSLTHALKGQRILRNAGYRCELEKSKRPGGCAYQLVVIGAEAGKVLWLLEKNNVPVTGLAEE
ncbi:MAG: DUF3343 domain-containing protein [Ruminococcus sp.]|nr:DUF3343 domain-containing protein [Ruminococcus sp.]MBQ8906615.1 DUF3343 domain-containing protein [Ruminococcus sp.]